jgi:hypothetical protein
VIHIVLTDDWELRGDGSGDPRVIQFEAIRRLRRAYEDNGLRGSFNVEVMQQLAHIEVAHGHSEIAALASEWEDVVRETYAAGHDVQLHVHPQWSDAVYDDGRWELRGAWSLLDYSAPEALRMLVNAKSYLEGLLRPLNPDYRCVSFRSGSWCIAPSPHLMHTLSTLGIVFDMSIADGLYYDAPHVRLDYRQIDEPFLPYYPDMVDARRMAPEPAPIVCVPTHTFDARVMGFGLRFVGRQIRRRTRVGGSLTRRWVAPRDIAVPNAGYDRREYFSREWAVQTTTPAWGRRPKKISDLCGLSFVQMREMLRDIRRRARIAGLDAVPIVIENHSKDVGDIAPVELFARELSRADDVAVLTASDLARNIRAGAYAIKSAR